MAQAIHPLPVFPRRSSNRRTQPLIRYEISDMLRVSNEKYECGRPVRCLEEIEGGRRMYCIFGHARNVNV
jgi:phenylacetate-coenzyme A ligase PaaK-like adenylate-forming protein